MIEPANGKFFGSLWLLLALCSVTMAADFRTRALDRTALERVYYNHRLGTKLPFEQVAPPSLIERLVNDDLQKEIVLRKAYGLEISAAVIETEVQRINTTTRAPAMLVEIKAALGNDKLKFANTFAKPILVERLLREKFDNDDTVHGTQSRTIDAVRERLLVARRNAASVSNLLTLLKEGRSNQVSETMWQMRSRPESSEAAKTPDDFEIKSRLGPNAQIISSPPGDKDRELYFEDLPSELQKVLRQQLRQAGDVSSVLEMRNGFVLYLASEITADHMKVATLSLRKRSYDEWLAEQSRGKLEGQ